MNVPFICSRIPPVCAYEYISLSCGYYHDFLDNKEATESVIHSGEVEGITSKMLRLPLLWNIV